MFWLSKNLYQFGNNILITVFLADLLAFKCFCWLSMVGLAGCLTIVLQCYDTLGWVTIFFQSVLHWSVAVSTICRHSSRVVAFLQAVARLKFRGPRSASIARSQVWLGLLAGRFQSGSTCRIHAARARWWSSRGELRAIWPKSRRRLLVTRWESGEQPVVLLTSAFDTWLGHLTCKIVPKMTCNVWSGTLNPTILTYLHLQFRMSG